VDQYEAEAQQRWGKSEAFKESQARTVHYTHADFAAAKIDQETVTEDFAMAFGNRIGVKSAEVQMIVTAHRAAISKWFYECSIDMQKNLAQMYIQDERFKAYYESRARGLAQYIHDAIMAQKD
jgi:hypothetical protein